MSDVQTCLALCVVSAGAPNEHGIEAVERQIDAYLATSGMDQQTALLTLKSAFEEMRLDGRVADAIAARLTERISAVEVLPPVIGHQDVSVGCGSEI